MGDVADDQDRRVGQPIGLGEAIDELVDASIDAFEGLGVGGAAMAVEGERGSGPDQAQQPERRIALRAGDVTRELDPGSVALLEGGPARQGAPGALESRGASESWARAMRSSSVISNGVERARWKPSQSPAAGSGSVSGTSSSMRAPSVVGQPSASTPRPSAASQSVVARSRRLSQNGIARWPSASRASSDTTPCRSGRSPVTSVACEA